MEINKFEFEELSTKDLLTIEGGSEISDMFCYACGVVAHGFMVFATEGGNNAGLCVR
ncbi:hypothetical protein [Flavobacterium sp.]|uniref:hypothetical protein n=1 Tax=Flavobacterium sp. TaxID=239 RepID=UPI00374DAF3C